MRLRRKCTPCLRHSRPRCNMRVEEIQILVAGVLRPPPDLNVSQWADQNRRLSSESAAERGEWRTDRAPYQRAIMDALSPSHPCEQVVLMSGAQLGKTSILENFIGYIIDLDPGPILLVQPREADTEAFSVDRYPASAGSEGDPVNLAVTRTANFWNRKIVLCSTPTVKDASRIEAAWLESNQQSYWVPCPHCRAFQLFRWSNVEWPEREPEKAQYRCEHCSQMIGEHQKAWMLVHGEWRAAHPESEIVGFWISSLYSPWRKWRELAKKFLMDKKSPETLREFINTVLAEL